MSRSDQRGRQGWDGADAPGGTSSGQSPARGAPDPAPRSGAGLTTRAAMAYLHGSDERQQVIADALSSRAAAELGRSETRPSGTTAGESVVSVAGQFGYVHLELRFGCGAPGTIRTRDPLLRRHM
jgi:hypothetical protein